VLSDSAVVCGASAKGRSSSRRLNHLLRKLAGLPLRYEIKVELIWTPTVANPADPPSRGADLEEMLADLPRRLEEWSAARLQEQTGLEDEASRAGSSPGGDLTEPPQGVRPLVLAELLPLLPAADDAQVGLRASGDGASPWRLDPPPELQPPRPQAAPSSPEPRRERGVELLPPRAPPRSSSRSSACEGAGRLVSEARSPEASQAAAAPRTEGERRASRERARFPRAPPLRVKIAVEFFSGSGAWAVAMRATGVYDLVVEVDLEKDSRHDLSDHRAMMSWVQFIKAGLVVAAHFGIVCASCSLAVTPPVRNASFPEGFPDLPAAAAARVTLGNRLARYMCVMIRALLSVGADYSIENPGWSWLWSQPCLLALRRDANPTEVFYDCCRYGKPYKKTTRLWSSNSALSSLGLHCQCRAKRVQLRGYGILNGKRGLMTRAAQGYAAPLVAKWARMQSRSDSTKLGHLIGRQAWERLRVSLDAGLPPELPCLA